MMWLLFSLFTMVRLEGSRASLTGKVEVALQVAVWGVSVAFENSTS